MPHAHRSATPQPASEASQAPAAAEAPFSLPDGIRHHYSLTVQRKVAGAAAGEVNDLEAKAGRGITSGGHALPHGDVIQQAFGRHDVSGVRAHTDGAAQDAARSMQAHAYACGQDVAFADAAPSLHTAAHEAAHTVQQRGGVQHKKSHTEPDAYEDHADAVADRVVRGESAETLLDQVAGAGGVQRKIKKPDAGFYDTVDAVVADLGFPVNDSLREQIQGYINEQPQEYSLDDVRNLLGPKQIFVKFNGRTCTLAITLEHKLDGMKLREAIATKLNVPFKPEQLAGMRLNSSGKQHVTASTIGNNLTVDITMGPPQTVLGQSVSGSAQPIAPQLDQDLIALVTGLQPDATIPCSHIDDNHTSDDDSKLMGEKQVGNELIPRFLSVREIGQQQALSRVLSAVDEKQKFTVVLIDPGFDETTANHRHMIQIVEYLQGRGHKFTISQRTQGKQTATLHQIADSQVTIVYVAAFVRGEKLPNTERLGESF